MPRMTSNLETAADYVLPLGEQIVDIKEVKDIAVKTAGYDGAGMPNAKQFDLTWVVASGEHKDKDIRFDNVIYWGKKADGTPYSLKELADLIETLGIAWFCGSCESIADERPHDFYRGTGTDGLIKGKYYCPSCKGSRGELNIDWDTDNLRPGLRCKVIVVGKKKDGSDKEYAEISRRMKLQ